VCRRKKKRQIDASHTCEGIGHQPVGWVDDESKEGKCSKRPDGIGRQRRRRILTLLLDVRKGDRHTVVPHARHTIVIPLIDSTRSFLPPSITGKEKQQQIDMNNSGIKQNKRLHIPLLLQAAADVLTFMARFTS
jgi:hypothetical protein